MTKISKMPIHYITQFPDPAQNFTGAPLVNYTIQLVNTEFSNFFNHTLSVRMCNRHELHRKKVHEMIAIVSGALYGCSYAHSKYYSHLDIMNRTLSDEDLQKGIEKLRKVIETIQEAISEYERQPRERFYELFGKCQKFIGSMLCDLEDEPDQDFTKFKDVWK